MEGNHSCKMCEFKTKKMESLNQHMKSKHTELPDKDVMQQLSDQINLIMKLEKEAKTSNEEIRNTNEVLAKIKVELDQAHQSLQRAKETAKVQRLELKTAVDTLSQVKEELEKSKANNKSVEETETKKKEISENVESSTQTDIKEELSKARVEHDAEPKQDFKYVTCKYFNTKQGCRRGSLCWFSHTNTRSDCKYWKRGFCRNSNTKCLYDHKPTQKATKSNMKPRISVKSESSPEKEKVQAENKTENEQTLEDIQQALIKLLTMFMQGIKQQ